MVGIMKKQFVNTRLVTMLQFEREKERLYIFNKTYLNRLSIPIEKVVQNHLKCNQHHYLQLLVSFELGVVDARLPKYRRGFRWVRLVVVDGVTSPPGRQGCCCAWSPAELSRYDVIAASKMGF